jgi:hypothetical protein
MTMTASAAGIERCLLELLGSHAASASFCPSNVRELSHDTVKGYLIASDAGRKTGQMEGREKTCVRNDCWTFDNGHRRRCGLNDSNWSTSARRGSTDGEHPWRS